MHFIFLYFVALEISQLRSQDLNMLFSFWSLDEGKRWYGDDDDYDRYTRLNNDGKVTMMIMIGLRKVNRCVI